MPKKTNKVEPLWQWPGKKKSLEQEEWWFEDCPDDELHFCWAYEYGRHIDAILMEHSKDEENDFRYGDEDILENGIWSCCLNLYENGKRCGQPLEQFGIYAPFGFPQKPYLTTDRTKLDKDRIKITNSPILPVKAQLDEENNYNFEIKWQFSNKEIVKGFEDWLKTKIDRPKPIRRQGKSSKKWLRKELKQIGVYRLKKWFGSVSEGKKHADSIMKIYGNENKWHTAFKEVEERISMINTQSGFCS